MIQAEWKEEKTWGDVEKYSNCNYCPKPSSNLSYWCGNFCANCGLKMKNPHFHIIEIDWGD